MQLAGSIAILAVILAAGRQQVASNASTCFNGFDSLDKAGARRSP